MPKLGFDGDEPLLNHSNPLLNRSQAATVPVWRILT